jgi:2-polyprenyl-3-methyl-5-hydroxy-6-metoxy-1,4-benzoquinol methylase
MTVRVVGASDGFTPGRRGERGPAHLRGYHERVSDDPERAGQGREPDPPAPEPRLDAVPAEASASDVDRRERLVASWDANAAAWTEAVRRRKIASRHRATNGAVLEAVLRLRPHRVLDVGCGEGWLAHALAAEGVDVVGFDASEALVRAAGEGPGTFVRLDYDALQQDPHILPGPFDVAVCNFSILERETGGLFRALAARLAPGGRLVVQTLHPLALGAERYADGWHEETFDGFGGAFPAPMPWYARTLASWWRALNDAGLALERVEEPRMEDVAWPVSLLFTAAPSPGGRHRDA